MAWALDSSFCCQVARQPLAEEFDARQLLAQIIVEVMPQPALFPLADGQNLPFQLDPARDIPSKPPRMDQPFLLPQPVGVDQHLPLRAVFVAQPRAMVLHRLLLRQPVEHLRGSLRIHVQLGDVPPEDFVPGATHQLQFRLVDAQNAPVRSHPEQAQGRFREEVSQLLLAPAQGFLGLLPRGDVADDAADHRPAFKRKGAGGDFDREDGSVLLLVVAEWNSRRHSRQRKLDRRLGILRLGGDRAVGELEELLAGVTI